MALRSGGCRRCDVARPRLVAVLADGPGVPVIVRVVLEDRPGALGAVASRIGAVGADVVAVEIVDRRDGHAVDELSVLLPEGVPVELLRREVNEVDRVRVEQIRPAPDGWDPLVGLLSLAARLGAVGPEAVLAELADGVRVELGAPWAAVLASPSGVVLVAAGTLPPVVEQGGAELATLADNETAVAPVGSGAVVVLARPGIPFRWREREAVRLLADLAAARLGGDSPPPPG